jgi:hypothetical protein
MADIGDPQDNVEDRVAGYTSLMREGQARNAKACDAKARHIAPFVRRAPARDCILPVPAIGYIRKDDSIDVARLFHEGQVHNTQVH